MASKGGGRRNKGKKTAKTQLKKNQKIKKMKDQSKRIVSTKRTEEIEVSSSIAMAAMAAMEESASSSSDFEECSTPKAERFRIPEIKICPPAPKKQRITSNCSSQKPSPISFFASPDIEMFFFLSSQ
ncbi:Cyclin-dependent protein kinase inhibitor SMR13, partial [Cucurbita argyrosperma subsp. argyrosperma]